MSLKPPKTHALDFWKMNHTFCGRRITRVERCGGAETCTCERCLRVMVRRPKRVTPDTPEEDQWRAVPRAALVDRGPRWMRVCDTCDGAGCSACEGKGRRWHTTRMDPANKPEIVGEGLLPISSWVSEPLDQRRPMVRERAALGANVIEIRIPSQGSPVAPAQYRRTKMGGDEEEHEKTEEVTKVEAPATPPAADEPPKVEEPPKTDEPPTAATD